MARASTKDLVNQAAEEAVKKALAHQSDSGNGELNSSTQQSMNEEEEAAIQNGEDDRDVFDLAEDRIKKFNDGVIYEIYKEGTRLGTKPHPYSWDKLQKDFGAGLYRIVGRGVRTKQIFKHTTMVLGEPMPEAETFAFSDPSESAPPPAGSSLADMMLFMSRQDESRRRDAEASEERRREADRESRERSNDMIKTIIAAASTLLPAIMGRREEPKSVDQNVMEFLKSTVETQNKMIERLQDRVEKTVSSGDRDPFSAFEMMESMQDRAMRNIKMMEDLAKEKAEEMMAMSGGRSGGDDEKPKSVFESMMVTMLPAIAKGIVGLSGTPAQAQLEDESEDESEDEARALPEPRRLPQRSEAGHDARRAGPAQGSQGGAQARVPSAPGQRPAQKSPAPQQVSVAPTFMGLPTAVRTPEPKPALQAVIVQPETIIQPLVQPLTAERPVIVKTLKEQTLDLLAPYIGSSLKAQTPAAHAAQTSITMLQKAGLNPSAAVREFNWSTIQALADSYGIPALFRSAVNTWLKEYHDTLVERTQRSTATG